MKRSMRVGGLIVALVAMTGVGATFLGAANAGGARPSVAGTDGVATLRNASGDQMGVIRLTQGAGYVIVRASVAGLTPGFHGFHVHANNDPANGDGCIADPAQPSNTWFLSVDGHYKLGNETHGAHQGDLPILLLNGTGTADSTAVARFRTDRFLVSDVVGRAVIVHALADNFANIPLGVNTDQYTANSTAATDKTAATGNAGDRLLCGIIEATP